MQKKKSFPLYFTLYQKKEDKLAMIQTTELHDYSGGSSKFIRFGSDVFSPLLSPSACNLSTAINPQDVILNRDSTVLAKLDKKQVFTVESASIISPTGYTETVRTPYLNFNDIFFDTSPAELMFSIDCPNNDSDSSVCSNRSQSILASPTEEFMSLPPSSAILQSQLYNHSSDYFIRNNSFIEEIKSSLTVEQQQYITSSMTRFSSTYSCASPSKMKESYDLITPDLSHALNIYQPDLTAYDDIFEKKNRNYFSDSDSDSGTAISSSPYDDGFKNDKKMDLDFYRDGGEDETRLKSLLNILEDINYCTNFSSIRSKLDQVRTEYISEITVAFIKIHQSPVDDEFTVLCSSVIEAYNSANRNVTKYSAKAGCTDVQMTPVTNKKRKKIDAKDTTDYKKQKLNKKVQDHSLQQEKKTRKNYDPKSINALMDWYLSNDGKAPSGKSRQILSHKTGKSEVQSKYFILGQKVIMKTNLF